MLDEVNNLRNCAPHRRQPASAMSLLRILAAATAMLVAGAVAPAVASPAPARVHSQTTCCLKVTIDAAGAYIADYGPETANKDQDTAGKYQVDWAYHVRGFAKYVEFGAGNSYILFLWHPGTFRAWAAGAADLHETDHLKVRTTTGWYDHAANSTHCGGVGNKKGAPANIDIRYRPWEQNWGNGISSPPFRAEQFGPACGGSQPYDAGLFGKGFLGDYLDFRFPFPTAQRAQLRNGTMNASTICTNWKQKSPGPFPFSFRGYMTEQISLDSFPAAQLKAKSKALDKLLGQQGKDAKGFDNDPERFFYDNTLAPQGKPGCHKP